MSDASTTQDTLTGYDLIQTIIAAMDAGILSEDDALDISTDLRLA